jgi:hypothetical protein
MCLQKYQLHSNKPVKITLPVGRTLLVFQQELYICQQRKEPTGTLCCRMHLVSILCRCDHETGQPLRNSHSQSGH